MSSLDTRICKCATCVYSAFCLVTPYFGFCFIRCKQCGRYYFRKHVYQPRGYETLLAGEPDICTKKLAECAIVRFCARCDYGGYPPVSDYLAGWMEKKNEKQKV